MNLLGVAFEAPTLATGFGSYIAQVCVCVCVCVCVSTVCEEVTYSIHTIINFFIPALLHVLLSFLIC